MPEILSIQRKTLSNQSINQSLVHMMFVKLWMTDEFKYVISLKIFNIQYSVISQSPYPFINQYAI